MFNRQLQSAFLIFYYLHTFNVVFLFQDRRVAVTEVTNRKMLLELGLRSDVKLYYFERLLTNGSVLKLIEIFCLFFYFYY